MYKLSNNICKQFGSVVSALHESLSLRISFLTAQHIRFRTTNGRPQDSKVCLNLFHEAYLYDFILRKRKLTDKSLPNAVIQNPDFAEDSRMYQDLLEMERKLDWTTMRKKVEVQDALARHPTVRPP